MTSPSGPPRGRSLRSRVKGAVRGLVFAATPLLGLPLAPLRLLDLLAPGNRVSLAVAAWVDRRYPRWFHLHAADSPHASDESEFVASRERSARTNMDRYGVDGGARRFLEVGCGTGAKTALWARVLGAELACGCDLDLESLRLGARAGTTAAASVALAQADGTRLPYRDGAFDLVLCEEVLEHVAEPELLLAEFRRVLAPGGRALVLIGPLYLHAKGPHLQDYLDVMWPHVLFSHATIDALVRSKPPRAGLLAPERVLEVFRTLNRHGEGRYRRAIAGCGLETVRVQRVAEHPFLAAMPLVGAYYRKSIRAVLRRPG